MIELLVVISLVALIVALLMPTLSAAREAGRRSQCLSNLRGIYIGIEMYAADKNAWLPNRFGTQGDNANYPPNLAQRTIESNRHKSDIKDVFLNYLINSTVGLCPSNPRRSFNAGMTAEPVLFDPRQDVTSEDASTGTYVYYGGGLDLRYGENTYPLGYFPAQPGNRGAGRVRQTAVKRPDLYGYLWDRMMLWNPTSSPWSGMRKGNDWTNHVSRGQPDGANTVTMDGNIGWVPLNSSASGTSSGTLFLDDFWFVLSTSTGQPVRWRGNPVIAQNAPQTIYYDVPYILDLRKDCNFY